MSGRFGASTFKKSLSTRFEVHKLDAGLTSVRGAQEVISSISAKAVVTKLLLGHNELGDAGCKVLFTFLCSQPPRVHAISEISLNSNRIGNEGLLSLSQYIVGNTALKDLFVQANALTGEPHTISTFVEALNSSRIGTLSLTSNKGLGDRFAATFFPALNCPSLKELHISNIGLTPLAVPYVNGFIRSKGRCRLNTLKCNGNALGAKGVKSIIRSIRRHNYSLTTMEFHATQLPIFSDNSVTEHISEEEEDEDEPSEESLPPNIYRVYQSSLHRISIRNKTLKRELEHQTLQLLQYARTLLLHRHLGGSQDSAKRPTPVKGNGSVFAFTSLPIELQLYILGLLAPLLSSMQHLRIFQYAASPTTLPPLLPLLPSRSNTTSHDLVCVADPTSLGFGSGGSGKVRAIENNSGQCGSGKCMGTANTVSCGVKIGRSQWLDDMGCSAYDPE